MAEKTIDDYLENTEIGKECKDCGEPMKLLHFKWGDSETHEGLITILNTILEEDEMLDDPLGYEKLILAYCEDCQAINLSLRNNP